MTEKQNAHAQINHNIDFNEVLRRLGDGDRLRLDASFSYKSVFDDGTEVPHQVMSRLVDGGLAKVPGVRGERWLLKTVQHT